MPPTGAYPHPAEYPHQGPTPPQSKRITRIKIIGFIKSFGIRRSEHALKRRHWPLLLRGVRILTQDDVRAHPRLHWPCANDNGIRVGRRADVDQILLVAVEQLNAAVVVIWLAALRARTFYRLRGNDRDDVADDIRIDRGRGDDRTSHDGQQRDNGEHSGKPASERGSRARPPASMIGYGAGGTGGTTGTAGTTRAFNWLFTSFVWASAASAVAWILSKAG